MISVQHLNKFLGGKQLLDDVNFRLGPGEKAAIVGANGTGKSTLLRICAGVLNPDSGEVSLPNDANVGYLPQHADLEGAGTVYEALRWVFREVDSHFEEMDRLAHRMAEVDPASDEYEKIADRYGHLQHEIDRLDAYEIDPQIDQVMTGLGFTLDDRDRDCSKLSGGWQMRVILGRVLLSHPDVLLLDEPTNHLDLETMIWLENWIRDSQASVLMISHERKFMDALAERVFELHDGIFTVYRGNYTEYLAAREERWAQWEREYENQQIEIDRLEKFIGRFRYNASKAQLVQSRIKQLDKIERIAQPPRARKSIHFRFPQPERANKEVVAAERLSKSFGAHEVLHRIDFTLWRGEKVALVGLNGAGKSTLLKILAGRLDPDDGRLDYGPKTSIEYFAQYDKDGMSEKNSVWQEMASAAPPGMAEQARDLLGGFSFSGEDVEKSVSVLSGGERTRVRLAKMLFSGSNLLLLDEPTNHLDIDSRKTLERALTDYEGTVVLVSHDRVFLDAVATRVCEIKDGGIRSFPGNYSEYAAALERLGEISQLVDQRSRGRAPAPTRAEPANVGVTELADGASSDGAAAKPNNSSAGSANGAGRSGERDGSTDATPRPSAKELSRERRRLEKRAEELEREIASIERRQNEINEELLRPAVYSDPRRARPFQLEQDDLRDRHAACLREWESCGEQLESLPRL